MAVRLRLKRLGRRGKAYFRIGAFDMRSPRDGRAIEELGSYDPLVKDDAKRVVLNKERVEYWLKTGAKPTITVANILKKHGIKS